LKKLRLSSIFEKFEIAFIVENIEVVFYLRRPRIVLFWLRAWQKLISLLFRVGVGGIGTKASPSILLWLRALQKNVVNSGHLVP
jgi:hypothetical protein